MKKYTKEELKLIDTETEDIIEHKTQGIDTGPWSMDKFDDLYWDCHKEAIRNLELLNKISK